MLLNRNIKIPYHEEVVMHVSEVERHRNGVAGDGFYAVRFTTTGPDASDEGSFVGVVADNSAADQPNGSLVYVIDQADLTRTMRGHDYYGEALIKAVNAYLRVWSQKHGYKHACSDDVRKGRI